MHSKAPTGKNTSLMMVKIQTPWGGQKVTFLAIFGIFVIFSEKNGHFPNNPKLKGPKIHHFLTPSKNTSKIYRDAFPKIEDFLEKSRKKTRPEISSFEKCRKIHRDAFPKIALFWCFRKGPKWPKWVKIDPPTFQILFVFRAENS